MPRFCFLASCAAQSAHRHDWARLAGWLYPGLDIGCTAYTCQVLELGKVGPIFLLMTLDRLCYYNHSYCTSKKLTIFHKSYRQELLDFLVRLVWNADVYAAPFLAPLKINPQQLEWLRVA